MHGVTTKTVLCHGVFDVLHIGHKRHLEEARSLGDRLIVSITPDEHVNKGENRPVFTAEQRKEMLLALECVDDVIVAGPTGRSAIEAIKPAVYVKGIDYDNTANPHHLDDVKAVEAYGGRVHITRTDKFSSTRIINGFRMGEDAISYLASARERGFLDKIKRAFDVADRLRILFVGETIIDEYRYVKPLAKPSKEFILATVTAKPNERFAGGVVAASLHADWPTTDVLTQTGDPLRKTRYVDCDFNRKLFEVYSRQRVELNAAQRAHFQQRLAARVDAADAVIAFDFGHGLIGQEERRILQSAKFFAVNAQTNAGNHGFNQVTRYGSAHLICIDEPEARLAADMQFGADNAVILSRVGYACDCVKVVMTRGRNGASVWQANGGDADIPSFATRAVDTIGAGDAFLAVTAPLVAAGLDLELAAFAGNVAGALKTDIVGHRKHVSRGDLLGMIEGMLK